MDKPVGREDQSRNRSELPSLSSIVSSSERKRMGSKSSTKKRCFSDSKRSANANAGIAKPNLPPIIAYAGAALRARRVLGATPRPRSRRSSATSALAVSRIASLDPTALDGRRPEVAVPAGQSRRAGGSVQRVSSPRPDGSDRTRAWQGAPAARAASIPAVGCQCRTSSLGARPLASVSSASASQSTQATPVNVSLTAETAHGSRSRRPARSQTRYLELACGDGRCECTRSIAAFKTCRRSPLGRLLRAARRGARIWPGRNLSTISASAARAAATRAP